MIAVCAFSDWGWPPKYIVDRLSDAGLRKLICAVLLLVVGGMLIGMASLVDGGWRCAIVVLALVLFAVVAAPMAISYLSCR